MGREGGRIRIIGGKWRGRLLTVLDSPDLRPTSDRIRETLFNWLAPQIFGARCLDLFAGSGALGFEALSRGAKQVTFVEKHPAVIKLLKQTAQSLETLGACHMVNMDSLAWLQSKHENSYDIIFLDPPFASDLLLQSIKLLSHSPLLSNYTIIYMESSSSLETSLPARWQLLKHKKAGHVFYHLVKPGELV